MSGPKKQEVVSFKVDTGLSEVLKTIPNRSEFIRSAILSALQNGCPLCQGTGTLTPEQIKHWTAFTVNHTIRKCDTCDAIHMVCQDGTRQEFHE